ncbi:MAG: DUF1549 and DUF1553 domain-containing protein [Acidobacteria bacterium]|nr:DUF1549 and DUF1553 domain-containing protein [Acidobacteriota bacterium]
MKAVSWVKNPIDRCILAGLEQNGLEPARPASKATLLRRVTFHLTGLPPCGQTFPAGSGGESSARGETGHRPSGIGTVAYRARRPLIARVMLNRIWQWRFDQGRRMNN